MGGTVYYKTRRYEYVGREIGYVPKEVSEESTAFEEARKNNTHFECNSRVGTLLRWSVKEHFEESECGITNTKLASLTKKALKADTIKGQNPKLYKASPTRCNSYPYDSYHLCVHNFKNNRIMKTQSIMSISALSNQSLGCQCEICTCELCQCGKCCSCGSSCNCGISCHC
jgi:hypothetical protein